MFVQNEQVEHSSRIQKQNHIICINFYTNDLDE